MRGLIQSGVGGGLNMELGLGGNKQSRIGKEWDRFKCNSRYILGRGGAVIVVNFEQEYIVRTNKFQPKAEIAWV